MSLKLFRSTGYSSILVAGESRLALHPAWLVLGVSLWIGFACNVALWRQLAGQPGGGPSLSWAVLVSVFTAALIGAVLSLFGWRRTLKPAATLLLLAAGALACGIWAQAVPVDPALPARGLTALFPAVSSLMRWQTGAVLALLALLPMVWMWQMQLRRLPGSDQLAVNLYGMVLAGMALGGSGFVLMRGIA